MQFSVLMWKHYDWLTQRGYVNYDPNNSEQTLARLALVTSELGEACNECRQESPNREQFAEELADIVLRVMGIAEHARIDLEQFVIDKIEKNIEVGNKGRAL